MIQKDYKIIFKQVKETHIDVIMQYKNYEFDEKNKKYIWKDCEKVVGHIFSPTAHDKINAIQICGISEAYDLWGCGVFGKPKINPKKTSKCGDSRDYYYDSKGNKIMEQVKDICVYFDKDTIKCESDTLDDCLRCYNTPCTCDNKVPKEKTDLLNELFGESNPYSLKRTNDIKELIEKEPKKEEINKNTKKGYVTEFRKVFKDKVKKAEKECKELVKEMQNDKDIPKVTEHLKVLKSGFPSKKNNKK